MHELSGLFAGSVAPLGSGEHRSAINKHRVAGPMGVTTQGLVGDEQADLKAHGGPDRALLFHAETNYAHWQNVFPADASQFVPGSFGENLSAAGWEESEVCIGDRFSMGDVVVEVSQPRAPCWKLDEKFGLRRLARAVQDAGMGGWYCRVLQEGELAAGMPMDRIDRGETELTISALWKLRYEQQPNPDLLSQAANAEVMPGEWRKHYSKRLKNLGKL